MSLAMVLSLGPAFASGFSVHDLRALPVDTRGFVGGAYSVEASAERLILACTTCAGLVAVDVRLATSSDGTEQRYRSGETTVARMEELCRERSPTCRLRAVEVRGAVGWVTSWQVDDVYGATVVLYQDGDLLTLRSVATDAVTAERNADRAVRVLAPEIVGAR